MKLSIQIELRFSQQAAFYAALVYFMLAGVRRLDSESLTLSTYYPSPLGVYKQVVTTGTGNANTLLARDGGNVGVGTSSPGYKLDVGGGNLHVAGSALVEVAVGIGTNSPSEALHVANNARVDGYIVNLCTSVGYGAGGFTSCPDSRMTMVGLDPGSDFYGVPAYYGAATGRFAGWPWYGYTSFPIAGSMYCCRF